MGWGAMITELRALIAAMPLPMTVPVGFVLGMTQPMTPMGFARTRTPGSSGRMLGISPTEGLPRRKFQLAEAMPMNFCFSSSTVPMWLSETASSAISS